MNTLNKWQLAYVLSFIPTSIIIYAGTHDVGSLTDIVLGHKQFFVAYMGAQCLWGIVITILSIDDLLLKDKQ